MVIACCSSYRHAGEVGPSDADYPIMDLVDLHTAECPIELTSANAKVTIEEANLEELRHLKALNLYAVRRKGVYKNEHSYRSETKDEIFQESDAWDHSPQWSERGICMFLSSLRLLNYLTETGTMALEEQDAVLHVTHAITRFPPAVRALGTLMNGRSPRYSDRAALIQSINAALKRIIPPGLIDNSPSRYLEGTRLLFGFILHKSKDLKDWTTKHNIPYMSSALKFVDFENKETKERMIFPCETDIGMIDRAWCEALRKKGPLRLRGEFVLGEIVPWSGIDGRVTILSGGLIQETYVLDITRISKRYSESATTTYEFDVDLHENELTDLSYLATLAVRNNMNVVDPIVLRKTKAPALTLDGDGLLAVFVQRPPCAPPDLDVTIFRPTRDGDADVDVSVIAQQLVPVLASKAADGTDVFDCFGENRRQLTPPEEIIILCVDCSASMGNPTDFRDIIEDSTNDGSDSFHQNSDVGDLDLLEDAVTLDALKQYLSSHCAFSDMLAIVASAHTTEGRRKNAENVLEILDDLHQQTIRMIKKVRGAKKSEIYSGVSGEDAGEWQARAGNLFRFRSSLLDFLVFKASDPDTYELPWIWNEGDPVPDVASGVRTSAHVAVPNLNFAVPTEHLCPISQEIMEDPVTTSDGGTYERFNIDRWLQMNHRLPNPGPHAKDPTLRSDLVRKRTIAKWVEGTDILSACATDESPTLYTEVHIQTEKWPLELPRGMEVRDLYHIIFRRMKGRYTKFQLHHRSRLLDHNSREQLQTKIPMNSVISVTVYDIHGAHDPCDTDQHLLLKIYQKFVDHVVSYWVPRSVKKSAESIHFGYWRALFEKDPSTEVQRGLQVACKIKSIGDNWISAALKAPSMPLAHLFDIHGWDSAGTIYDTTAYVTEQSRRKNPRAFKVAILTWPEISGSRLSRLDVLKQTFESFINRIVAYNYRTHLGKYAWYPGVGQDIPSQN